MEEAGGRKRVESRVEDRGSCRSNEMEGRCEVHPATFDDKERIELKLDGDDHLKKNFVKT